MTDREFEVLERQITTSASSLMLAEAYRLKGENKRLTIENERLSAFLEQILSGNAWAALVRTQDELAKAKQELDHTRAYWEGYVEKTDAQYNKLDRELDLVKLERDNLQIELEAIQRDQQELEDAGNEKVEEEE